MDDSNESDIDWEREYHVINNKMKQFHLKAAKAREKIYKQMEELKAKTLAAEERAENAETELCLLRESLSGNNKAVDVLEKMNKERLMLLEEQCFKLEIQKAHLQESLSKELQARKRDKETLQEKSTKIKQWVMQTLRIEAEEKNFLRDAKKQLELQVEDLQGQIQEILEREGSRILDVNSMNSSKQSTVRSNSSTKKVTEGKCEDLNLVPASKESSSLPSPMDLDDISNIHDGEFPLRATTTPQQVPSEAVSSWENSSINRAINQLGEQCNNVTFDPNPNITFINPPPPPASSSAGATSGGMRHLPSSIRRRLQSLADRGREEKKRISDSKSPRNETPTFGRSCPTPMMQTRSKSTVSREEITLLPVAQENPDFSRSLPSTSFRKARRNNGRPPTPPRHQHAVWESKIYSLTKTGFQFSSNALGRTLPSKHIASTCEEYEPGEYAHVVHRAQPLTVPVYTKIKGRAQQIRHEPLSTSSSESSDDDVQATCIRHKRNSRGGGGMNQSTTSTTPRIPKGLTSLEAAAAIAGCSLSSSNNATCAAVVQRANGSPSVARAIKRANSQQSMTSVESDYAIPPDAYGSNSSLVVDSSEPEYKLLKTSPKPETGQQATSGASFVASTRVSRGDANGSDVTSLQKSGYLKKLGGRSRTWKKRWFVLQDGKLVYYKASADPCCNVPGHHVFDIVVSNASVVKNSTNGMSFQVSACDRTYYLAASSPQQAEDWVKALNGVINARKSAAASATAEGLTSKNGDKLSESCIKCKVVRVVDGDSAIMWAIVNHNWLEFRSEVNFNQLRFDRVDLRHCVVDDDPSNAPKRLHAIPDMLEQNYVISLRDVGSGKTSSSETLLYFEHMSDKTNWMAVMNANSAITKITPFDKLVMQVLEKAKDKNKQLHLDDELWFNSILVHSNDIDYNQPLTSLKSDGIAVEASKLAKAIQRFANHELEAASTDFHVTIAQCIANTCMTHVQLRDELYAQLFRSTNRREMDKKRSKSSSYLQSWKLVALLTPLFIPSTRMMLFFKIHLQRHADSRSEVGQYASYCQRSIDRTSHAGSRVAAPSRTESVSILMHNPFHHSLPFSVPVHFDDGSYQVIGFHGSTTVSDFTRSITTQGGIRNLPTSGFALFVNDPEASCSFEHFIDPPVKVCDVISAWENAARRGKVVTPCMPAVMSDAQATADEKGANGCNILRLVGSPRFVLRRRLCFKSHRCLESNFERLLIIHQIGEKIAKDRFPVSRDLALELTALTAQIVLGPWRPDSTRALLDVIDRIFPARYRDARGKHCPKQQREKIIEKWTALKQTSRNECMRTFLNAVRRWPLCEATFFAAKNETCGKHKGDAVWIAVEEECLSLLHYRTMQVIDQIEYEHIATFGGCRNRLMVVVQKLGSPAIKKFFSMPKIQIFSCVQLMADYINASIKPDLNVF